MQKPPAGATVWCLSCRSCQARYYLSVKGTFVILLLGCALSASCKDALRVNQRKEQLKQDIRQLTQQHSQLQAQKIDLEPSEQLEQKIRTRTAEQQQSVIQESALIKEQNTSVEELNSLKILLLKLENNTYTPDEPAPATSPSL